MNRALLYLCATSALITYHLHAELLQGRSFFSPRSQSTNLAREMSGWYPHIYQYGKTTNYSSIVCTPAYAHSVRPGRIAQYLFGNETIAISGSMIENRGPDDILADYFGLSPQFASVVTFSPHITNGMLNFDGYWGFDQYCKGLYFRIHAPVVWTRWHLQMCEDVELTGQSVPFPPLYMAANAVNPAAESFSDVLNGTITFGQMQEPLKFGKVDGAQSTHAVSDVQLTLGWNFILEELGHVGLSIRGAAPTGTRPTGNFLFEPIVGNTHHWELGVGVNAHSVLWQKDSNQAFSFFFELNMMYLFAGKQRRSFDLTSNGFGSRYTLVKEFDANQNYTGRLSPLINHTTLECKVHTDIQCDILFLFEYTHDGFVFDIGYNGWIKSREKIDITQCFPQNRFAMKGIQDVVLMTSELSNLTQSNATLHGNEFDNQLIVADTIYPVFISPDDLDPHSAAAWRMLTHKLFLYAGYSWFCDQPEHRYKPFIGVGGEVEFEGENTRNTYQVDKPTMSQLGIWFKVGCDC